MALVTGAARRVGRAIALALFREGYSLFLHYRESHSDALALSEAMNSERPGSAHIYQESFNPLTCMSSSAEETEPLSVRCDKLMGDCLRVFGRCDLLVNNASAYFPTSLLKPADGVPDRCGSSRLPEETKAVKHNEDDVAAAALLGSNALAPYYLIRAFASFSTQSEDQSVPPTSTRSVVNIIDSMISRPDPGYTLYTMSKHALLGLTKSAAIELAPCHIRVNAVCPGLSLLPEHLSSDEAAALRRAVPLGGVEAPGEAIATAVLYLASAASVTGATLNVDGGWSLTR